MSDISDKLKAKFQDRLNGELESCEIPALDGLKIYWKPLTGAQQKNIQKQAEKSTAEGICMHVKTRALDDKGEAVFKDSAVLSIMNDFDFAMITDIFFKMTGTDLSAEEIEKN